MLMTEAEARKRWCPFARASSEPMMVVSGGHPQGIEKIEVASQPISINREDNLAVEVGQPPGVVWPAKCACIASSCMAWRREDAPRQFDRTRTTSGTVNPEPHGYCGLAGRPGSAG